MLESFVWLCQTARPWAGNRLPTSRRAGCSRGTQQIVIHNGDEAAAGKRSRARQTLRSCTQSPGTAGRVSRRPRTRALAGPSH